MCVPAALGAFICAEDAVSNAAGAQHRISRALLPLVDELGPAPESILQATCGLPTFDDVQQAEHLGGTMHMVLITSS